MSRELDFEGWTLVAVALVVGVLAGWLIIFHGWNENVTRAAAYTVGIVVLLVMALRPAWHRLRLWVDLGISLVLHSIVILSLLKFLDAHSVRLNWALALPFVAVEMLVLLSLLWRRNVSDSSP
jgi:uncharacterized membrane protein